MRELAALAILGVALMMVTKRTGLPPMNTRELLARTIYGEARGEGTAGMAAVAAVIGNRVREAETGGPRWWGTDVVSVILKPWQFSVWNADDPNRRATLAATEADPAYRAALAIADELLAGSLADPTGGATHYHTRAVSPVWADQLRRTGAIGAHVFYREV